MKMLNHMEPAPYETTLLDPRIFPMRDSHESVIEVNERRIVLMDADGARLEIADMDALDKKSRELIRKNLYL